ncbi:MAG: zinc-ribbon domain-containing protein [Pseudomonadota bacterium]
MRITCPNCQAQYDIDAAMIPAEGRDVQCSSCAHTWLELGPHGHKDDAAAGTAIHDADDAAPEDADTPDDADAADSSVVSQDAEGDPISDITADDTETRIDTEDAADRDIEVSAEGTDPADKLRDAIDRPKSDAIEPTPEPEDFVSDMRDAVADTEATIDDGPDDQTDVGDDVIAAAEAVAEETTEDAVGAVDDVAEEMAEDAVGAVDDARDPVVADSAPTDPSFDEHASDDGASDQGPTEDDAAVEEIAAATNSAPVLDDDIAEILRQEAEREVTQRRSEDPPALEAQAELGLGEEPPSEVLRERLERMRGDGVPQATVAQTLTAATAAPLDGPRRERLPDIEEIKTTLRPGDLKPTDEPPIGPSEMNRIRQAGFRRGFATLVLAAGVLVAGYVFAPQIIDLIPASEPAMMSYVDTANSVRDGIDRMMARAITGLNGLGGDA